MSCEKGQDNRKKATNYKSNKLKVPVPWRLQELFTWGIVNCPSGTVFPWFFYEVMISFKNSYNTVCHLTIKASLNYCKPTRWAVTHNFQQCNSSCNLYDLTSCCSNIANWFLIHFHLGWEEWSGDGVVVVLPWVGEHRLMPYTLQST